MATGSLGLATRALEVTKRRGRSLMPIQGTGGDGHPALFRVLTAVLIVGTTSLAVRLAVDETVTHPSLLIALAILMVIAENRDRVFGDETSMSGSMTVAIAAVFAFQGTASFVGP